MEVSEIGLGCRSLGGLTIINKIPTTFGNLNEKSALKIIRHALNLGINTFDTADTYSLGNSEKRLGVALHEYRSEVKIFTKAGAIVSLAYPPYEIDLSHNYLLTALNRSLKRLKTNYVDLFQTHAAPKNEKDFKNIEKAFAKVKSEGKALFCGVTIGRNYEMGIELIKRGLVDALQITFSILDPKAIEELLPLAKKNGVGIIVNRPLAEGLLTDEYYNRKFGQDDFRSRYSNKILQEQLNKIKLINSIKDGSMSLSQIAIVYVLNREEISLCIPGSSSVAQLKSNVEATNFVLDNNKLEKITSIQNNMI